MLFCLRRKEEVFSAHKLRRGVWVSVKLRITAYAVERLDSSGESNWICQLTQLLYTLVILSWFCDSYVGLFYGFWHASWHHIQRSAALLSVLTRSTHHWIGLYRIKSVCFPTFCYVSTQASTNKLTSQAHHTGWCDWLTTSNAYGIYSEDTTSENILLQDAVPIALKRCTEMMQIVYGCDLLCHQDHPICAEFPFIDKCPFAFGVPTVSWFTSWMSVRRIICKLNMQVMRTSLKIDIRSLKRACELEPVWIRDFVHACRHCKMAIGVSPYVLSCCPDFG